MWVFVSAEMCENEGAKRDVVAMTSLPETGEVSNEQRALEQVLP